MGNSKTTIIKSTRERQPIRAFGKHTLKGTSLKEALCGISHQCVWDSHSRKAAPVISSQRILYRYTGFYFGKELIPNTVYVSLDGTGQLTGNYKKALHSTTFFKPVSLAGVTMAGRRMTYVVFAFTLLSAGLGEETECPSLENTYAVTDVLSAMNKLLTILAQEVRELRSQVVESCTAKDNETMACATAAEEAETAGANGKKLEEPPPLNMEHNLPDGGIEAAGGENGTAEGETA
ncbi:uncharacterized protein LOC119582331, partial [Penaeus monodon]|uniref:uncharacterized protein LOC119582331 n=1 Tax=Penaeus monodon TaxID=6687 RepID=UPI0018A6D7A3